MHKRESRRPELIGSAVVDDVVDVVDVVVYYI